jgi:hypothetical protein
MLHKSIVRKVVDQPVYSPASSDSLPYPFQLADYYHGVCPLCLIYYLFAYPVQFMIDLFELAVLHGLDFIECLFLSELAPQVEVETSYPAQVLSVEVGSGVCSVDCYSDVVYTQVYRKNVLVCCLLRCIFFYGDVDVPLVVLSNNLALPERVLSQVAPAICLYPQVDVEWTPFLENGFSIV